MAPRFPQHSALSTRARACLALASALVLVGPATLLAACEPKRPDDEVFLDAPIPECADPAPTPASAAPAPAGDDPDLTLPPKALNAARVLGRQIGHLGGHARALRHVDRLTADGFWVRGTFARVIAGLTAAALGALAAAFILTLRTKRPVARWGDSLVHQLRRETREVRALGAKGDAGQRSLVERFEVALQGAEGKVQKLNERCRPLEERAESATAQAHLESLYTQMEGLLGRVEHIHFQIIAWSERAVREDDAHVQGQVTSAIDGLLAAMKETA